MPDLIEVQLATSWRQEGPLVMWLEVWKRIPEAARPRRVEQTYIIDFVFAGSAVSAVYSDILSSPPDLTSMDGFAGKPITV